MLHVRSISPLLFSHSILRTARAVLRIFSTCGMFAFLRYVVRKMLSIQCNVLSLALAALHLVASKHEEGSIAHLHMPPVTRAGWSIYLGPMEAIFLVTL